MKTTINANLLKRLPTDKDQDIYDDKLPGFVLRVRKSGRHSYRLNYGRGKWFTIGKEAAMKPHKARQHAKVLLGRVADGEDLQATTKRSKASTLRAYLKTVYQPWAKTNSKTGEATVERLLSRLGKDITSKKLPDVSPWIIEKWRSQRLRAGIAATTVNREVAALKAALNRAVDWGIIDENPIAKVKALKVDRRPRVRYLSNDEEQRLRKALAARDDVARAARDRTNGWRRERQYQEMPSIPADGFCDHVTPMILLALNTGMRRGELFNLRWPDIDARQRVLTVRGGGAKSSQTRHIPLNDEAMSVLKRWGPGHGLVFPGNGGKTLSTTKTAWANLMEKARITDFRFHDLRHAFASKLVMAGVDLNTVRELLGHADLQMTLRYSHLAPEHKHAAVALLDGTS